MARKTYLIINSSILTALLLLQSLATDAVTLITVRFFGVLVSLLSPIPMNSLMENIPENQRANVNMIVNLVANVYCIIVVLLVLVIMPNYEIANLKRMFLSIFAISLLNTFFYIFWEDSPRSLIINNNEFKAAHQLG